MGQQARTWPALTSSRRYVRRPRLSFRTSMMTLVSSSKVAMSTAGYFLKTPIIFAAQLLHPPGGSLLEFRVVLILPCSGGAFQCFDLAQTHQLLLGGLGEEGAAAPLANQGVDFDSELLRDD